ncbi:hypothetical protein BHE74_00032539 [Ensete ventricosum]|nr:hypothetical protein BHE74_00032539 [Ensete ventricosum]
MASVLLRMPGWLEMDGDSWEAVVGLGRALARKFNSSSFANRSSEDIEAGLMREYKVLAGPLKMVGKARHISASDVGGAWSNGKSPQARLGRLAAGMVELRVSVSEALMFFIAYHTDAPHHIVRGPYGEACACSWGMSTLPTLPMLGRLYDR